ncbi:MAG: NAD(P)H-hydrate epimerase [Candidatus Omnitrophota bacterium]|nr:NAD(P)H-hydrate epimerase [Candidatus Omnitrophota bacterium]
MAKNSKLLTAKEAKDIDIRAKEIFGISTLVLMENAGRGGAEEAIKVLHGRKNVAIFCGKGNNGGDGFVAARHLLAYGLKPVIFLVGRVQDVENEARINLETLLRLRQKIIEVDEENLHLVKNKISQYTLIIDALLGVGLQGEVKSIVRDLIGVINASKAYILSVDIPSGLDATTGRVLGCCVKADKTVTFVAKKRGMVIGDGPKYCGRIVVKDLGMPL